MRILVTGGAGYIGSHTILELLNRFHDILVVDNFSNSCHQALERIGQLCGSAVRLVEADILDNERMNQVFRSFKPEVVIHFAGLKSVSESGIDPVRYYRQNIDGMLTILAAMQTCDCRAIVFSSSATVYGDPQYLPIDERHGLAPVNPYGKTKLFIEEILRDWVSATQGSVTIALRYFNPVGAHHSGQIGEDPTGIPNNLMPYISQVENGRRNRLLVFGDDYDTHDGTGVRDYLHVVDLAKAHVLAIDALGSVSGFEVFNLGTGAGVSVLDMILAFEEASGKSIPYSIAPRREGDVSACWANPQKAREILGWQATHSLSDMCSSAWNWQSRNPMGYASESA